MDALECIFGFIGIMVMIPIGMAVILIVILTIGDWLGHITYEIGRMMNKAGEIRIVRAFKVILKRAFFGALLGALIGAAAGLITYNHWLFPGVILGLLASTPFAAHAIIRRWNHCWVGNHEYHSFESSDEYGSKTHHSVCRRCSDGETYVSKYY